RAPPGSPSTSASRSSAMPRRWSGRGSPRSVRAPATTPGSSLGRPPVLLAAVAAGAVAHRIGARKVDATVGAALHLERARAGVGLAASRRLAPLQQADGARDEEHRAEDRQPEDQLTHRKPIVFPGMRAPRS